MKPAGHQVLGCSSDEGHAVFPPHDTLVTQRCHRLWIELVLLRRHVQLVCREHRMHFCQTDTAASASRLSDVHGSCIRADRTGSTSSLPQIQRPLGSTAGEWTSKTPQKLISQLLRRSCLQQSSTLQAGLDQQKPLTVHVAHVCRCRRTAWRFNIEDGSASEVGVGALRLTLSPQRWLGCR